MTDTSASKPTLTKAFHKYLNSHGYGFQFSVIGEVNAAATTGKSAWLLEGAEVPVRVRSSDTRVDFVLGHATAPVYLVCECKRPNPRLADWCFARMPFVSRESGSVRPMLVERWSRPDDLFLPALDVRAHPVIPLPDSYALGFEVRWDESGEARGPGRGAIDDALVQVCRGKNGLAQSVATTSGFLLSDVGSSLFVLPVVFTTARLWTTDLNLSGADLATGDVPGPVPELRPADWIAFQYHQSVGITAEGIRTEPSENIPALLTNDFVRTVAIVSPTGIRPFLEWATAVFNAFPRRADPTRL